MSWTRSPLTSRARRALGTTALFVALSGWTDVSSAEPSPEAQAEGRRLYAEGRARFAAGDYAGAVIDFRRAHEIVPANPLLYNIAQALRLNGECPEAARTYREFIEHEPAGRLRELAEERLIELGECEVPAEPGAVEPAPPVSPAAMRPSPRRASPAPRRSGAGASPRESGSRATGAALSFGSAALLLSVSGYFAWRSDRASDRVTQAFERGERWDGSALASEREGLRDRTIAWTTLAGGIVAAGFGTWFIAFD